MKRSVIIGSGSLIPSAVKRNADFTNQQFYNENGSAITIEPAVIIDKFAKITGIEERRYADDGMNTSDIASLAAKEAIAHAGIDPETLDMIIVAHNFGNVKKGSIQSDLVPALASRVKYQLGIKNPSCFAYDVLFGCPGWVLGMIQVEAFFKAGMGKRALLIGAETLSRVIDQYDRDSMIFSDGAGAAVLEYKESEGGILSTSIMSHCSDEVFYLQMEKSFNQEIDQDIQYMKMKGRKVYEYALKYVPLAMKECLDKSGKNIKDLHKIFIHQANEKMDEAIVQAFYKLYGMDAPEGVMPMCIKYLGNSSVATIPTLFDIILKGGDESHQVEKGDLIMFASVGAGMNINAVSYIYE